MKIITYLSNITSIDETYWILITKTLIFFLFLTIIKKIGVSILKKINDSKKEYLYIQKYKLLINIIKFFIFVYTTQQLGVFWLSTLFCLACFSTFLYEKLHVLFLHLPYSMLYTKKMK